ncbi:DNA-binding SARP family transcriptional activator [Streptosporangium becharense]|uniref:DNA-binding SARP family transcriptional activator n=1 Tax=Streptosporangium becharense TaxID=1816182 RepID=A0A7W9MK79_9ACTN|nr:BTAD domain-containing putative transcriptional regulator [Streptosporangium becharense]MBB2910471.1 DNA-binding SARP family transcriptional activator [Streptosporangium becharense]MBB5823214.1 DNA-binding SARP family transcriptional activator [Streptosporangium becharense]
MEFRVLGPVEAYDNDIPIELGGPRQRAVLALLLIARGTIVPTDTLIDNLYDGAPPPSALITVQSYMSNLRRVIEPGRAPRTPSELLIGRSRGYLFATTDVDAIRFTNLVNRSQSRPPGEALALLEEALRLWRGRPYGEFADKPWAIAEVSRLCELRLVAVERRAQAQLDLGRPQDVISDLEAETAAHPLRERLWCLLALALYRTGRQAHALAVLRQARMLLAEQLGLDPGPELRALEEDILRQVESLAPVSAATSFPMASPSHRPAMLGRERQLAELRLLPVRAGRDGVAAAVVSGEPGIGKTQLLEAFRDDCVDFGYLVLWGRCHDSEGTPPLWPWLQILRTLEQHCPPPDRSALAGLLDEEIPSGSTEGALLRRNQVITYWLITAARMRPLVIVLDDLHWADAASLELLRDVVVLAEGLTKSAPLPLVVAFRDPAIRSTPLHNGAPGISLEDLLGRLDRYGLLRLRLTGLEAGDVRAVAAEMGAEVDEATARRLAERTGGNPFFVRETARLLAQGGDLEGVPEAASDLIRRRLAALGPQAGEVLRIAAVIGRDFAPGVVAEVCGAAEVGWSGVYDALDRAAQAGLVVPGDGSMAFAHDLVRETLLGDIPPLRKAAFHRDVMTALACRPGSDVAAIAHHAVEAGPVAYREAARWARAAAEQASLRMAFAEAARWWGRAIDAHGACSGDPLDHVELLLRQVRALLDAGDLFGARRARAEAVRAADRAEAGPELTARALTALDAPAKWTLRDPYEAVELRLVHRFETCLRTLPTADSPERARLLGGLAQELYDGTGNPLCDSLSAQAVQMARRLDDPLLLMGMLNARHLALPQPLHIEEMRAITDELHALALRAETPGFELLAQLLATNARLETFDVEGADQAAARCDTILERLPLPWPRFQHTMWRAVRLGLGGRFDDADRMYDEARRQAGRIDMWHADGLVAMGRVMLHYHRGSIAQAGPFIDAVAGFHPSMGRDARILQLCAQGRAADARKLAHDGWRAPPKDWSWLNTSCLQAAAQAALGQVPACRSSYATLLPYSGRVSAWSGVMGVGPVDWYLALLATATGDPGTARHHLAVLERLADRNGLTWWRDRATAGIPPHTDTRP